VTIYGSREREPVPLSLLHTPLCVTVSYYDGGTISLLDATAAEEGVREGETIISLNKNGELCQIAKYGGASVDAVALLNWTNQALEKVREISKVVQKRLEEDAKARDVGGLMAELSAENERPNP
jgi:exosome complex component RRP45